MKTYFIHVAAVRSAARLLGIDLVDNYALHGALPRYSDIQLNEVKAADGIDDVPQKAESFLFGTHCGKVLEKYLSSYNDEQLLYCEACIAREFFTSLTDKSSGQDRQALESIFRALLKRAQIRTHTTKPGYEDINAWLESYYKLQQDYNQFLPKFVDILLQPDPMLEKKYTTGFLNREDSLLKLILDKESACTEHLQTALEKEQTSTFAKIIRDIVTTAKAV